MSIGEEFKDGSVAVSDHGNLTGLANDDHIQYSLATGSRAFIGTVSGIDPVIDSHLATKGYVDTAISTVDEHNELLGLQGGFDSTEFYHLDLQTYGQISSTPTSIDLSDGLDVTGHSAMGPNATIDFGIAPGSGWGIILNMSENFDSSVTSGAYGIYLSINNAANDAGANSVGLNSTVHNNTSILHGSIAGITSNANSSTVSAVVTDMWGIASQAVSSGDNSVITNMIGGKFEANTAFSMANFAVTDMIGTQSQILATGSGETNITNGYGALIKTPGYTSSGITTNLYGLYIEDQSTVGFVNDYNIFSAGVNSENKFEGSLELASGTSVNEFSIDGTLVGDSDDAVPTEKAVKTYVDAQISATDEHNELLGLQGGDSTSEFYHLNAQLYNQMSSDATSVIFSGDIHCDDLFTSGDTIHVGTGQIKSTAGNVELYHSTTKVFETIATGIQAGFSAFNIKVWSGTDGITLNSSGSVDIFHSGTEVLTTIPTGIQAGSTVTSFDC